MFRSKSRSQMGGVGGAGATSPSPRPGNASGNTGAAAAVAASANATSTIVKNILKNVESHVRVMSHMENISISSSYTALRLRKPRGRRGGDSPPPGEESAEEEWSAPFTVSRVHRGVAAASTLPSRGQSGASNAQNSSTFAFYSDVIAPCVSNCCAGQSYLFLFTGPQESGRSQTLYGCPLKPSKHASPNPSQDPRLHPEMNEDGNERGVVELAAIDFLERVTQRQRQRMQAEVAEEERHGHMQGSSNSGGGGVDSEKENRGGGGGCAAAGEAANSSAGGLVVTFSAFTTRGDQIVDTITHNEVTMETFPPPLGTVALPYMHLLDEESVHSFTSSSSSSPSNHAHGHGHREKDGAGAGLPGHVVPILPSKKYVDTSCIVQFQVYACVDGAGSGSSSSSHNAGAGVGKRAMATFTFVDMAAFRAPLCKEVTSVVETVRKVAGLAGGDGADAAAGPSTSNSSGAPSQAESLPSGHASSQKEHAKAAEDFFKSTKLTQLLEPALTGYVTLVSVATISGREDLYDGACAALSFSQDIKRIHQVFFLLHIFTPRWLFETGCALEDLREERERVIKGSYARGVYDYYQAASRWLTSNVGDVEGQLEKLLEETETIRKGIEGEVQTQEITLQTSLAKEDAAAKQASDEARRAVHQNNAQFEVVKRLDEEIAQLEQKISHNDLKTSQRMGEMRIEISALEAKKSSREKEVAQLARERALFESKSEEVVSVVRKYAEDLAFAQVSFSCRHELHAIGVKRSRLEEDLEMASVVAHQATDSVRSDRARQALVSRVRMMHQRVASLRSAVHSSLSEGGGGGGYSDALYGLLKEDGGVDDEPDSNSNGGKSETTRRAFGKGEERPMKTAKTAAGAPSRR